jgi:uncharacterized protein
MNFGERTLGMELLVIYMQRAAPACVLGVILLLALPKSLIEWRLVTYVLLFLLLRDLMTPLGMWEINVSNGFLRLPTQPLLLLTLGIMSCGLVIGINAWEPALANLVVWKKGPAWHAFSIGSVGIIAVSILPFAFHRIVSSVNHPALVPSSLIAPLLIFSLLGNLLEEVLFRGYFQGWMEKKTSPLRAAFLSGIFFSLCHIYLATTVTNGGIAILIFTMYEGIIAGFVRMRSGVLASSLTHGGAIFLVAAGWI